MKPTRQSRLATDASWDSLLAALERAISRLRDTR